jgi:MYXO-CTERM domain-containing protein
MSSVAGLPIPGQQMRAGSLAAGRRTATWRSASRSLLDAHRLTLLSLASICVLGALLRGWNLVERPIWEDESYTWSAAQGSLSRLILGLNDRHHGPLSHLLVRLLTDLSGCAQPWLMRLPAYICGVLCIPAAFALGRAMHGAGLGLGAALLVAVDGNMIDQSHQARMYTMLMLVALIVLRQAARFIGATTPPLGRRPWISLGLWLGLLIWINFGGIALWLGLAAAAAATIATDAWRGEWATRGRPRLQGLGWTYLTATIFSARSLWLFSLMVRRGHPQLDRGAGEALLQVGGALLSLENVGSAGPWVLALAVLGLALLHRRHSGLAMLLAATGLATLGMVYGSRFVHAAFAPRYLTMLQPALWLGLAAVPVSLSSAAWRRGAAIVLVILAGLHAQDSIRVLRAGYWVEWEFFRTAAEWINERRGPDDAVFASPDVNYRCLARYYGLTEPQGERLAEAIMAPAGQPAENLPARLWMLVNVYTPPGQQDLRRLLDWYQGNRRNDAEAVLRDLYRPQFAVVCFEESGVACWEYRPDTIRLEPVKLAALELQQPLELAAAPLNDKNGCRRCLALARRGRHP